MAEKQDAFSTNIQAHKIKLLGSLSPTLKGQMRTRQRAGPGNRSLKSSLKLRRAKKEDCTFKVSLLINDAGCCQFHYDQFYFSGGNGI